LILILFIGQKYIIPPLTTAFNFLIMVGATLLVIFFQWW
jgi:hypothetical protein